MASREGLKVLSPGTMWSVAYSRMTTYSESPAPLSSPADQRRYSVCLPAVAMSAGQRWGGARLEGREPAAAEAHQCADVPSIPAEAARLRRRHAPQGIGFVVHDRVEGEQAVDA